MITIRRAEERGRTELDWLDSRHSFSFGDYHDPKHMGFRVLRVINDDKVKPGKGFGTHGHRDMEIVTYVLQGTIQHKDSMGNGSTIKPGDVQRMSAGTGVTHSELNPDGKSDLRLLQIWILPERAGLEPGYEQKSFSKADKQGRLRLVASRDGRHGSVTIHQDVDLYAAVLSPGEMVSQPLQPGRYGWLQVATGAVTVKGMRLDAGDGAALVDEMRADVRGEKAAEILLFDLP